MGRQDHHEISIDRTGIGPRGGRRSGNGIADLHNYARHYDRRVTRTDTC